MSYDAKKLLGFLLFCVAACVSADEGGIISQRDAEIGDTLIVRYANAPPDKRDIRKLTGWIVRDIDTLIGVKFQSRTDPDKDEILLNLPYFLGRIARPTATVDVEYVDAAGNVFAEHRALRLECPPGAT